jgi:hypothetical protein
MTVPGILNPHEIQNEEMQDWTELSEGSS